ncbi:MAG: nucleotidyltransferase domain-containing protein [Nitrospiraceae bacterium]|nr:nucleotidyltransferase domain-containing protein [Nitrospiraceae bacterium]
MIKFEHLPENILSRIPAAIEVLQKDENILFAYLFGGLVSRQPRPLSDVDIAVYISGTENLGEYRLSLFDRLTDALGTAELDLIMLNTSPVSIAGRILQNRRILVDKQPFRRHSYESLTLREFFDFHIKEEAFFKRRFSRG